MEELHSPWISMTLQGGRLFPAAVRRRRRVYSLREQLFLLRLVQDQTLCPVRRLRQRSGDARRPGLFHVQHLQVTASARPPA